MVASADDLYADQLRLEDRDLNDWCKVYTAGRAVDGGDGQSPAVLAALLRGSTDTERDYLAALARWAPDRCGVGACTQGGEAQTRIYVDINARAELSFVVRIPLGAVLEAEETESSSASDRIPFVGREIWQQLIDDTESPRVARFHFDQGPIGSHQHPVGAEGPI